MAQGLLFDLKESVLSNSSFGPSEIKQIIRSISDDYSRYGQLREAVAELEVREDRSPASAVRLGVCYYLMGRNERAVETLKFAKKAGRNRCALDKGDGPTMLDPPQFPVKGRAVSLRAGANESPPAPAAQSTGTP